VGNPDQRDRDGGRTASQVTGEQQKHRYDQDVQGVVGNGADARPAEIA
jgi:hypothetical protein